MRAQFGPKHDHFIPVGAIGARFNHHVDGRKRSLCQRRDGNGGRGERSR